MLAKYSRWQSGCSGAQSARQAASIGFAPPWSSVYVWLRTFQRLFALALMPTGSAV